MGFLIRRPLLERPFVEIGSKGDLILEILAGVFCGGIVIKYHFSWCKAPFWGRGTSYGKGVFGGCAHTKNVKFRDF